MERLNQWISLAANLGVIVGIVVVAYEIQANTNAVRSATYQGFIDSSFSWADTLVEHAPELAEIVKQGSIENLTPEQRMVWDGFAHKAITIIESNYLHHRAGALDDDVFEGRIRGSVRVVLAIPMLLQSFQSGAHSATAAFHNDFAARLEAARSQQKELAAESNGRGWPERAAARELLADAGGSDPGRQQTTHFSRSEISPYTARPLEPSVLDDPGGEAVVGIQRQRAIYLRMLCT